MWWNDLTTLQQVMFIIACVATAILVLQIILMLVSGAHDGSFDSADAPDVDLDTDVDVDIGHADGCDCGCGTGSVDIDGDMGVDSIDDVSDGSHDVGVSHRMPFGMRLLSFRSILAFITLGSWVCFAACYELTWYYSVIIAVACGMVAACGMAAALLGMEKLQSNGVINPRNSIGKVGSVYLTIPAYRSGRGKIHVLVQERYAEYDAITDSATPIPTGAEIKVVGVAENNVLIVEDVKDSKLVVEHS